MTRMLATCREVVDLVTEYLDGGLSPDDRLALERHVILCPPCRGHLQQMRHMLRLAGTVREEDIPDDLRETLVEAFRDWKRT